VKKYEQYLAFKKYGTVIAYKQCLAFQHQRANYSLKAKVLTDKEFPLLVKNIVIPAKLPLKSFMKFEISSYGRFQNSIICSMVAV